MISMTRVIAKFWIAVVAFAVFLPSASRADGVSFVLSTGNTTNCTAEQPCPTLSVALANLSDNGRVVCLDAVSQAAIIPSSEFTNPTIVEIDCPHGVFGGFNPQNIQMTMWIRNLAFKSFGIFSSAFNAMNVSGSLILENCIFDGYGSNPPLMIEPNGPFNLVIRNSHISNSASGVLLKPQVGGSIHATFDHVEITGNSGGGIKIDTTNGPVTTDITDSTVSDNASNGINAVAAGAGQNVVSIKNSVIARNGEVGVQANGANAGVLVQTTLFDQNAGGATAVLNGGHISTYGNNSIVGSSGSGFTGSAPLQ
jgi:hypothetical protein